MGLNGLSDFSIARVERRRKRSPQPLSHLACACAALLCAASAVPNAMPLGANIDGVVDYSWTLAFVNVVKQARSWGSLKTPWDGNCSVGSDGWPAQADFGNVFATSGSSGPILAGTWLMSFTGNATVVPANGASAANQVYDAATDTTTASLVLAPNACNCLMFGFSGASTRTGPGIKDLKILQPGYALAQAADFSAPLLALLGRVDVLRFMDWGRTNGNLIQEWGSRTLPSAFSFAAPGSQVPWEVIFDLANTLQKDAWINIPAHATDDYVQQLATLGKVLIVQQRHRERADLGEGVAGRSNAATRRLVAVVEAACFHVRPQPARAVLLRLHHLVFSWRVRLTSAHRGERARTADC